MTDQEFTGFGNEELTPGEAEFFSTGGQNFEKLTAEQRTKQDQAPDQVDQVKSPAAQGLDQVADQVADQVDQDADQAGTKPDQVTDQVDQAGTKSGKPGHVPVQALHESRERERALRQALEQANERWTRADARMAAINELLGLDPATGQKAAKADELIDPEKDIFGAFKQQQKIIADLNAKLSSTDQRFTQQARESEVLNAYASDARRFMAQAPDFSDAYQHLLGVRNKELELLGVVDQGERNKIMAQEEKQIASQAFKSGRSPAQIIYDLSKARGFTPKAAETTKQATQVDKSSIVEDAAKQLEAAQKGREAFPTLSGTGSSGKAGLTVAALADMSEDEFERATSKLTDRQRRELFGG